MAENIIDYNDQRLTDVEKEGTARKQEVANNYNQMISERDAYTQQQQQNVDNWAKQQTELQQAQTAQTINKINQQKEQSAKDYTREQKGAYTDYMKQSNQYGANAEMLARQGLSNSGYQESSEVSMWNTYQNRYATARESYKKAVLEYDNMMKEAELSNNETLANIAQQKLEQSLQLALEGFEYKNNLIMQRDSRVDEIDSYYNTKYQDVLAQINREYEYAEQQRQAEIEQARWQSEFDEQQRQWNAEQARWQAEFDLEEQQRKDALDQWEKEYALKKQETQATISKLNAQSSSYSGGSGYALTNSSSQSTSNLTDNAKKAYNTYLLAKKAPIVGKFVNLESYLQNLYNKGKLNANELQSIINVYG